MITDEIKLNILKEYLVKNYANLPFVAQKWNLTKINFDSITDLKIEYGHYKTNSKNSIPFYKPISKIIDISILS